LEPEHTRNLNRRWKTRDALVAFTGGRTQRATGGCEAGLLAEVCGGLSLHADHSIEHPADDAVTGSSQQPSLAFRRANGGRRSRVPSVPTNGSFSFDHALPVLYITVTAAHGTHRPGLLGGLGLTWHRVSWRSC
jgi:hypothetical protein